MKLAVIGIGDLRRQDKGITIRLLDKLKKMVSNLEVSFIKLQSAGYELYELLSRLTADKVLILDTACHGIELGKLTYLHLSFDSETSLQELLVITIGILKDDWGRKLSTALNDNFFNILNKISAAVYSFCGLDLELPANNYS